MQDFDKNNDNAQQSVSPTDIGKKRVSGLQKSRFHPGWFWRRKIVKEQQNNERFEYIDEDSTLQERQGQEQKEQVAVDTDRNSRGNSPPIIMNKSELNTDIMGTPKQKKKNKLSFKKLIKRNSSGSKKRR